MDVAPDCYGVDDLLIDVIRRRVTRNGSEIRLTHLTFTLLVTLVQAAPEVVSVAALMKAVWPGSVIGPEIVSQRVKSLRVALRDDPKNPRYVAGVRGRGYRVVAAVEPRVRTDSVTAPARLRAVLRWN
jgi:two-component system alkaline phosphatase synthesis response regulator PhoP